MRALVAALLVLGWTPPTIAGTSRTLTDVRIVRHFYTTSVLGVPKTHATKDPGQARFLVLIVTAQAESAPTVVFAVDFVLAYQHKDGKEDRANASGVAELDTVGSPAMFHNGQVPRVRIAGNPARFALYFLVEEDVERVELLTIGGGRAVLELGTSRPYSVYLTTNTGADAVRRVESALTKAGYDVRVSEGLNKDHAGVRIIHHDGTELIAHRIADTVRGLGWQPKLVTFKAEGIGVSEVDVLVWVGRPE